MARAAAVSGLAAAKANPGDPSAMAALGGAESGLAGALPAWAGLPPARPAWAAAAMLWALLCASALSP